MLDLFKYFNKIFKYNLVLINIQYSHCLINYLYDYLEH